MFYKLQVKSIENTTADCSIIEFEVPQDLMSTFQYRAGQYLTLEAEIKGERVRRCYSLCSSPLENKWKIGVKKIEGGKFSSFANDQLSIGDKLQVMSPRGKFGVDLVPASTRAYAFFAAGSGITPVISIITTLLLSEPNAAIQLFYFNKNIQSIILKEELHQLKNQFLDRFEIFHFLTQQKRDIEFLNGRLNDNKMQAICRSLCDIKQTDHFFICGPEPMIRTVQKYLSGEHIDSKHIHFELFTTDDSPLLVKKQELKKQYKGEISTVHVTEGGKQFTFSCAKGESTILDEALKNATELPFACKGGVCATCIAKLVNGEVNMLRSYGLEQEQIDDGYILTCQSVPISQEIVVDYDI